VGDFCYEQQCAGFENHLWLPAAMENAGFSDLTWFEGRYVALGVAQAAMGESVGPAFMEFDASGEMDTIPYSANGFPPLSKLDGRVAVGEPDRVFYRGLTWTKNNKLKQAIVGACPALGLKYAPSAVVHRHWELGIDQEGSNLSEFAVIGFRSLSPMEVDEQCLLALCGRAGDNWSCGKVAVGEVFGEVSPGESVAAVTALWAPLSGLGCLEPTAECLKESQPLVFSLESDVPEGRNIRLIAGHGSAEDEVVWTTLFEAPYPASSALPETVREVRVDAQGNVFAVGADHFLFASPGGWMGTW